MRMIRVLSMVMALALGAGEAVAQQVESAPTPPGPPPFQGAELGEGPWRFETEQADLKAEVVARGLERPWGMAFAPGGDILVTERPGRLRLIREGSLDPEPITGVPPVYALGIAGLMDVALHPDFAENRLIYLAYSKPAPDGGPASTLAVMRAKWDGGHELSDVEDIFVAEPWYGAPPPPERCCGQGPAFGSYGGRLQFDSDGYLYVTSGDRNYGELVQDRSTHFGKILRLNDDGSVPPDNPFVGVPDHAPEIWSLGHRNPLGLSIDPETGEMWESEFGPRGGDEVNKIERGGNYGWIFVTQGHHYNDTPAAAVKDAPGYIDPVVAFGPPSINPGNVIIYRGSAFPQWQGDMLLATFANGLMRADMDASGQPVDEEFLLRDLAQRWRDVRVGPAGDLWLLTDQNEGALIRVSPAG